MVVAPEAPIVVECRGVRAAFGDTVVFQEVDVEIRRGEVFVLLGGSGCGKSTLLRQMVGLLPPSEGTIRIAGVELSGDSSADASSRRALLRRIGVGFQSGALFGSMTLLENVAVPLEEYTELPRDAIDRTCRVKLELVGLAAAADRYPSEVSGGMLKRAALARAMALDPELIFLDEPSAGLDPVTSADLDALILRLRDALGITFVVVTHELASIYAIADRCIMLDRDARTVIARGNPRTLRDESNDARVVAFFRRERPSGADSHE